LHSGSQNSEPHKSGTHGADVVDGGDSILEGIGAGVGVTEADVPISDESGTGGVVRGRPLTAGIFEYPEGTVAPDDWQYDVVLSPDVARSKPTTRLPHWQNIIVPVNI
jgi:hypothetical protein